MNAELKEKLLMLQESDFAADDMKLYLDTHPNDAAMLMKLYLQVQKSMLLRNEIETRFGYPITAGTASMYGAPFKWINSPWPWSASWPAEASVCVEEKSKASVCAPCAASEGNNEESAEIKECN